MYLEIAGRRTGKTNRLINQIIADKDNYDVQILMGVNHLSLKEIKSKIKKNNKLKVCLSWDSLRGLCQTGQRVRLYVDEFMYSTAFCNNWSDIFSYIPQILKDGYFTSSLNTRYHMVLDNLQKMNDGMVFILTASTEPFI